MPTCHMHGISDHMTNRIKAFILTPIDFKGFDLDAGYDCMMHFGKNGKLA